MERPVYEPCRYGTKTAAENGNKDHADYGGHAKGEAIVTTGLVNYWTHGEGVNERPHEWRYLGRVAQMYMCIVCQLRVTKADLKEATDA